MQAVSKTQSLLCNLYTCCTAYPESRGTLAINAQTILVVINTTICSNTYNRKNMPFLKIVWLSAPVVIKQSRHLLVNAFALTKVAVQWHYFVASQLEGLVMELWFLCNWKHLLLSCNGLLLGSKEHWQGINFYRYKCWPCCESCKDLVKRNKAKSKGIQFLMLLPQNLLYIYNSLLLGNKKSRGDTVISAVCSEHVVSLQQQAHHNKELKFCQ